MKLELIAFLLTALLLFGCCGSGEEEGEFATPAPSNPTPTFTAISAASPTSTPTSALVSTPTPAPNPTTGPMLTPNPQTTPTPTPNPKCPDYRAGSLRHGTYPYVLRGEQGYVNLTLYDQLFSYQQSNHRDYFFCPPDCYTDAEMILIPINEQCQKPELVDLAGKIAQLTPNKDDQARIAISLVQQIPYDEEKAAQAKFTENYPYETIYKDMGVCGEKSKLAAYLLKELGFGVVLFQFDAENHMALGIKCPEEYSYKMTGYCFVETTGPSIITYSKIQYYGVGELTSTPDAIKVSDGYSLDSVSEEYNDSQTYEYLNSLGPFLEEDDYNLWLQITTKYGLLRGED